MGMEAEVMGWIQSLKEIRKVKRGGPDEVGEIYQAIRTGVRDFRNKLSSLNPKEESDPKSREPPTNSEPPVYQPCIPRWQGAFRITAFHGSEGLEVSLQSPCPASEEEEAMCTL